MSEFGKEVLVAARSRIGNPFAHHFMPENLCDGGLETNDLCMERGLGEEGYDCSGLVIASLCDVLGLDSHDWPRKLRHARQLEYLAYQTPATAGDILIHIPESREGKAPRPHIGIFATAFSVVHANGRTGIVDESEVAGAFERVVTIPAWELAEALN